MCKEINLDDVLDKGKVLNMFVNDITWLMRKVNIFYLTLKNCIIH